MGNPNAKFSIDRLRMPEHKMNRATAQRLLSIKKEHKKITEEMIREQVEPRMIVFLENGFDLEAFKRGEDLRHDQPWTR